MLEGKKLKMNKNCIFKEAHDVISTDTIEEYTGQYRLFVRPATVLQRNLRLFLFSSVPDQMQDDLVDINLARLNNYPKIIIFMHSNRCLVLYS